MSILSKPKLRSIMDMRPDIAVSMFLPTHRSGPETRQDPIRFKNLVGEAEKRLKELGMKADDARSFVRPAMEIRDNPDFWKHQSDGLAVYLSERVREFFRVPISLPELVVVAGRFAVKPVLPLFTTNGRFFILALNMGGSRMFEATRHSIREMELKGVSTRMDEETEAEKQLQVRTRSTGGASEGEAQFHGQGKAKDSRESLQRRFVQDLEKGIHGIIREEQSPLVLCGVDGLTSLYREATSYPHLLEDSVSGSPETQREEELHRRAWEIVEPLFKREMDKDADQVRAGLAKERASTSLADVVSAAVQGRVGILFTAVGKQVWGTYRQDAGDIQVVKEPGVGDYDLLDLAAAETLLKGGRVYAVKPDEMPTEGELAAVYRH